ncbi:MAG: hypothetical protein LAT64_11040, partial [Phycisphaerales bacterium]|nr:hypothetical protein [Phycisphaerales bacterium]
PRAGGGGGGGLRRSGLMPRALARPTCVGGGARHDPSDPDGAWLYHIQAAGGIVADSVPELEFKETVNKAAALGRAIDLAERAF